MCNMNVFIKWHLHFRLYFRLCNEKEKRKTNIFLNKAFFFFIKDTSNCFDFLYSHTEEKQKKKKKKEDFHEMKWE